MLLMPASGGASHLSDDQRNAIEDSIVRAGDLLPRSKTVWLEDSVHDVPLQRPDLVARVIEQHIRDGFFGELR